MPGNPQRTRNAASGHGRDCVHGRQADPCNNFQKAIMTIGASQSTIPSLGELLDSPGGVVAPLVLNPLMAKLAQAAGFAAGYLGGGAMGYQSCVTEANLSLTQMAQAGLEIRAQADLPLIMDGTCGWGDPVHVRNTVRTAEAAGFCAIEIEDQILPKRVHHHVGIEALVSSGLMQAKVREAVRARRDRSFLIIARTNAARVHDMDEALRRAEAFHRCGADVLLVMTRTVEDLRTLSERLPRPLMYMLPTSGIGSIGLSIPELVQLGFRLIVDPGTPLFAMHRALRRCYQSLRAGARDPTVGSDGTSEERHIHDVIGLEHLLDIERCSLEAGPAPSP
jgi:methylisocitrate lyase